ncbi:MAG: glycoside hydrolase family 130 protein [Verrucomicrobia bacterium]|nr:glycoside hydrolase family 130 protein [Verrucomicrobiota bacterium]MBV8378723.1 glycoside hydrolase family 130 protein [Verrucomicrobiota bacterium]
MNLIPAGIEFRPDAARVLIRPFFPTGPGRVKEIIERILALGEFEVKAQLDRLRLESGDRHTDLDGAWLRQFDRVRAHVSKHTALSENRRLVLGAYFTGEYAIESAALFNPSIVPHPDQTNLEEGELRFVLSLRAVGEGHISSIEFRTGIIRRNHALEMDRTSRLATAPEVDPEPTLPKSIFTHKLNENGLGNNWSKFVMDRLGHAFSRSELFDAMHRASHEAQPDSEDVRRTIEFLHWLVEANYEVNFNSAIPISGRVIFPVSLNETNGMEDARFVRFVDEDQSATYYATYTAYNGRLIQPQLISTSDFLKFRVSTLAGPAIQNKGMALFPKRIHGRYAMLSRYDDQNLFLMFSEDLYFWRDPSLLLQPCQPWEFVKIGNCGSPIETEAGWLVLTHGVGPMRKYCLGAALLDLEDPSEVLGRLKEPLLETAPERRDGYVPNVIYTCGALVHRGQLVLPYGLNDSVTTIATIELEALLAALGS